MSAAARPVAAAPPPAAAAAAVGTRIGGIEALLPPGERVLWVGGPARDAVARHVFHARRLALYFAALLALPLACTEGGLGAVGVAAVWVVPLGVATVLFALGLADLVARTTIYAVTDRRVVMRVGIALPVTVNLPLADLDRADLRPRDGGRGDIVLTVGGERRLAWLLLWPHVRPWQFARPQPALLGVPDAAAVGRALAGALEATRTAALARTEGA